MPRQSKKSQYTEKRDRTIYALINPVTKEFYISHCRSDLLKDVFKQHLYGKRYQTEDSFLPLRKENDHPCLFVLDEVFTTKVDAFNYVIVWTKIFSENKLIKLNTGSINDYIEDLYEKNEKLYETRKHVNIEDICSCEKCLVQNYNRRLCKYINDRSEN